MGAMEGYTCRPMKIPFGIMSRAILECGQVTIYVLIKGGQCAIPPSALRNHDDFVGINNFQRSKVIDTIKPSVWLSVAKAIPD